MWTGLAEATLGYAEKCAARGLVTQVAGLAATAAMQYAHAALAAGGQWPTNEKALLARAGMGELDAVFAALHDEPAALRRAVAAVRRLGAAAAH